MAELSSHEPLLLNGGAEHGQHGSSKRTAFSACLVKWVLKILMWALFVSWVAVIFLYPSEFFQGLFRKSILATQGTIFGLSGRCSKLVFFFFFSLNSSFWAEIDVQHVIVFANCRKYISDFQRANSHYCVPGICICDCIPQRIWVCFYLILLVGWHSLSSNSYFNLLKSNENNWYPCTMFIFSSFRHFSVSYTSILLSGWRNLNFQGSACGHFLYLLAVHLELSLLQNWLGFYCFLHIFSGLFLLMLYRSFAKYLIFLFLQKWRGITKFGQLAMRFSNPNRMFVWCKFNSNMFL